MANPAPPDQRPTCFGVLEKVFPMSAQGLREVQRQCWDCALRVDCLRQAQSRGDQRRALNEERIARQSARVEGVAGFLQRWSRLKRENQKGGA